MYIQKRTLMFSLILLVFIFFSIYWFYLRAPPAAPPVVPPGKSVKCETEMKRISADDPAMKGVVEPGVPFDIELNYYACHGIERGDVVVYRFSSTLAPVVRIVRAIAGDEFKVVKNEEKEAWNLSVNGKLVPSADGVYFFGGMPKNILSIYVEPRHGILRPGEVILLSKIPPGGRDSSSFGVANVQDVIAKVHLSAD